MAHSLYLSWPIHCIAVTRIIIDFVFLRFRNPKAPRQARLEILSVGPSSLTVPLRYSRGGWGNWWVSTPYFGGVSPRPLRSLRALEPIWRRGVEGYSRVGSGYAVRESASTAKLQGSCVSRTLHSTCGIRWMGNSRGLWYLALVWASTRVERLCRFHF